MFVMLKTILSYRNIQYSLFDYAVLLVGHYFCLWFTV